MNASPPPAFVAPPARSRGSRDLNMREYQVLRLVSQGMANKEVAATMNCSEPVVKAVLQQLFRKTSTHSRAQLVRVALEQFRDQM